MIAVLPKTFKIRIMIEVRRLFYNPRLGGSTSAFRPSSMTIVRFSVLKGAKSNTFYNILTDFLVTEQNSPNLCKTPYYLSSDALISLKNTSNNVRDIFLSMGNMETNDRVTSDDVIFDRRSYRAISRHPKSSYHDTTHNRSSTCFSSHSFSFNTSMKVDAGSHR